MANNTYIDIASLRFGQQPTNPDNASQLSQLHSRLNEDPSIAMDETNNSQNTPNSFMDNHFDITNFEEFWNQPMFLDNHPFGLDVQEAELAPPVIGSMGAPPIPDQLNSRGGDYNDLGDIDLALLGGGPIQEAEGTQPDVQPKRTRRPKSKAPPHSDWLKHKPIIRDLYLEQDNTLEETRQIMKDDHDFDVTPNLYKQKFQEWGWVKNMPQNWTPKLTKLAEERQPKDTVFQLGPRKWTADEIKKKRERASLSNQEDSPVLPAELIIRTPSLASPLLPLGSPVSGPRRLSQGSLVHVVNRPNSTGPYTSGPLSPAWVPRRLPSLGPSARPWTPSNLPLVNGMRHPWSTSEPTDVGQGGVTSHPLHTFRIGGKSITDLQHKRSYAKTLASKGQFRKAIDSLKEVLLGFRHLLTPTHQHTTETAYELAEMFRQDDRMAEADSTLNWISENHVRKFGLRHQSTMNLVTKTIILLRSWSRDKDADLLVHKLIDLLEADGNTSVPLLPGANSGVASIRNIEEIEIDNIFSDLQESDQVDAQLRLVELLLESCPEVTTKLEGALQNIISFCKEKPIDDAIRLTRARYWLTRLYLGTNRKQEAGLTFDIAVELLKKHINNAKESMIPMVLVGEARKLAFLHPNPRECNQVLEMLADHLEDRIGAEDQNRADLVNFIIHVGITWQRRSWNLAAPWFQRALGLCLTQYCERHPETVKLEEALEKQRYDTGNHGFIDAFFTAIGRV
ncbi:hypothetical protein K449DRAFT_463140 [Hypoxylon sp. EC38]|nr:hypothetical protein K449DRAFT_463140 [Hypoxylon sp. EC38]